MARVSLEDADSPDPIDEPEPTSGKGPKDPQPPAEPEPAPQPPDPAPQPPAEPKPEGNVPGKKAAPVARGQVAGKEKLQPYVSEAIAEAARNAVVATTPFEGGYQSISDLIEDAIAEKVQRLQRKFNNGEPFPQRPRKRLKTGRPAR